MTNKPRAAVAMSGGVDSTVAAYLALQQGFDVVGINLLMHKDVPVDETLVKCCQAMDIPLIVRDCTGNFYDKVLYPGALEYVNGRTPNPCCECNECLKFQELFDAANELGIDTVITGHYAKLQTLDSGNVALGKAADSAKDQSYFLYRLSQEKLRHIIFPLSELSKSEVRAIAARAGLICAVRPDSQDACFQVQGECCGDTLCRLCGVRGKRGYFIYNGRIVGHHTGLHRYTIGQRKGLNVALGVPAYIKSIDAAKGNIVLCTDQDELGCTSFTVSRCVWQQPIPQSFDNLMVKVRYRTRKISCTLHPCPGDPEVFEVRTLETVRAVTPGQAAVFFDGDILIGGGTIDLIGDQCMENSQPQ